MSSVFTLLPRQSRASFRFQPRREDLTGPKLGQSGAISTIKLHGDPQIPATIPTTSPDFAAWRLHCCQRLLRSSLCAQGGQRIPNQEGLQKACIAVPSSESLSPSRHFVASPCCISNRLRSCRTRSPAAQQRRRQQQRSLQRSAAVSVGESTER